MGDIKTELTDKFAEIFGSNDDVKIFFAPGRVNLIGEHTDYNGGHVFPCALSIGTYGAARKRSDRRLRFYSLNFEEEGVIEGNLEELKYNSDDKWTNYPKGVIWALKERGYEAECGMDILVYGNIPNGSGLSSSASIEVLTGFMCRALFGFDVSLQDLAIIGQEAENKYIGVNCGIMDQFAIAMGREEHAIFLDTSNLKYEYVPLKMDGVKIVISNTNKKRGLADSKYNERRSQCEAALSDLKTKLNIESLGELTEAEFEKSKSLIKDEINAKRAKHAVYENQRTIKAVADLEKNDIESFGKLMNDSHVSLRDDYEVTGIELDTLAEEAWKQEGVIGSRMTGAGFGGCAVSLVKEECVESFIKNVGEAYEKKIGHKADFYVVSVGGGPRIINN